VLFGILSQVISNQKFIFSEIPNSFLSIVIIVIISTIFYTFIIFFIGKFKSILFDITIIIGSIAYYIVLLITYISLILVLINKVTNPIENGLTSKLLIISGTVLVSFLLSKATTYILNNFLSRGK